MGDRSGGEDSEKVGEEALAAAEQALLDAALDFYGAAQGVIDYGGRKRPQLRHGDTAGFDAVRRAMALLEERVAGAHSAGASPERIAQIARIEQETIVLILQRQGAAPAPTEG